MLRSFSSVRARFAATAVTVFALVALGGVTATPAFALGSLDITVNDDSTGASYFYNYLTLTPREGGDPVLTYTDGDGARSISALAAGDYYVNSEDPAYVKSNTLITVQDSANTVTVHVDKYRVSGTVPVGMGSGNTTAVIQQDAGGGFVSQPGTQTVSEADDTFSLTVPNGPGTYRILFQPPQSSVYADSYSATFTVDGTVPIVPVGSVAFDIAPTLSGHVNSFTYGGPIEGAVAHAVSGGILATAITDVNGDFSIKVPSGARDYTVYVDATNYVRHYYNFSVLESHATPVAVNDLVGYARTGLDFALEIDTTDLTGNLISSDGAYAANMTLYIYDTNTSRWSSYPYYTSSQPSSTFSFGQLPIGDFRMTFSHPATGVVLPANGACYLDFSSAIGTNVTFADVLVDPNAGVDECDEPAWLDAGDASVTGTVENIDDVDHALIAQLMGPGPFSSIVVVDSATVDPTTGEYSLRLQSESSYYIRFITDDRDDVLDTLLGSGGNSAWNANSDVESSFHSLHRFWADPSDSATLEGHDVTLAAAATIDGSANHFGDPVEGWLVARDVDDGYRPYAFPLDANGEFTIKLPAGYMVVLSVEDPDDVYVDQFWPGQPTLATAEQLGPLTPGHFGTFDFHIDRTPAELWVWTSDAVEDDEIIVHLYVKDEMGDWIEVESKETVGDEALFFRNFDSGLEEGLVPGDYRVRFESLSGTWLEAVDFGWGEDSSDGEYTEATAPSCFIDFEGLNSGVPSYIEADFDINAQTTVCGPEPAPLEHPTVSGNTVSLDELDYDVDFTLYKSDGGNFGPTPFDANLYGPFFSYSELPDGDYRLAFADRFVGNWLPWQSTSLNGTPLSAASTGSDCYLEFTVVAGTGDLEFSDVVIDTEQGEYYCDEPPWAVPANGEFSGTVTNISAFSEQVVAVLFDADGDLFIDVSIVNPTTGAYSLSGLAEDGEYYVLFEVADSDMYLSAVLGDDDGDQYLGWANDNDAWEAVSGEFAFELEGNTDYENNDVELPAASVFNGVVRALGVPVSDVCVTAESANDVNLYICTGTDEDGQYWLKVPVGGEWVLSVTGQFGYPDQYWENKATFAEADVVEATTTGIHSGYDFELGDWPSLVGIFADETAGIVDGYVVHLYKPVTGGWVEVAAMETGMVLEPLNFSFDSLTESPYRLRFESPTGDWVNLSAYFAGDLSDIGGTSPQLGDFCFIDIPTRQATDTTLVLAVFDSTAQTGACAAEPAVDGEVTPPPSVDPRSEPGAKPQPGPKPEVVAETPVPTPTASPSASPSPSAEPTVEPSTDPEETGAALDLGWLWILITVILVLLLGCAAFVIFRRR